MPPIEPEPDPLLQTRLPSTVSGHAQPLSPPPTLTELPRVIVGKSAMPKSPARALLGTIADGPSWRLPYTLYGTLLSTSAWYICASGSCSWIHDLPRLIDTETPPSWLTIIRLPLSGSIQMSWWSPPGVSAAGGSMIVVPPSSVFDQS